MTIFSLRRGGPPARAAIRSLLSGVHRAEYRRESILAMSDLATTIGKADSPLTSDSAMN